MKLLYRDVLILSWVLKAKQGREEGIGPDEPQVATGNIENFGPMIGEEGTSSADGIPADEVLRMMNRR